MCIKLTMNESKTINGMARIKSALFESRRPNEDGLFRSEKTTFSYLTVQTYLGRLSDGGEGKIEALF